MIKIAERLMKLQPNETIMRTIERKKTNLRNKTSPIVDKFLIGYFANILSL